MWPANLPFQFEPNGSLVSVMCMWKHPDSPGGFGNDGSKSSCVFRRTCASRVLSTSYWRTQVLGSPLWGWGSESWRIVCGKLATNDEEGERTLGIEYLLSLPFYHPAIKVEERKIPKWCTWEEQETGKGRACPNLLRSTRMSTYSFSAQNLLPILGTASLLCSLGELTPPSFPLVHMV